MRRVPIAVRFGLVARLVIVAMGSRPERQGDRTLTPTEAQLQIARRLGHLEGQTAGACAAGRYYPVAKPVPERPGFAHPFTGQVELAGRGVETCTCLGCKGD